jgi:hypothetical protein
LRSAGKNQIRGVDVATNHGRRLDRLEEIQTPSGPERWHRVIGHSEAELEKRIREMIASGEANPNDGFSRRLIVSPGH